MNTTDIMNVGLGSSGLACLDSVSTSRGDKLMLLGEATSVSRSVSKTPEVLGLYMVDQGLETEALGNTEWASE